MWEDDLCSVEGTGPLALETTASEARPHHGYSLHSLGQSVYLSGLLFSQLKNGAVAPPSQTGLRSRQACAWHGVGSREGER